VLAVLCWSGFSERVHPLGWVEPGVAVVADVDVPPVVVDDAVMVSTKEYQVAGKSLICPHDGISLTRRWRRKRPAASLAIGSVPGPESVRSSRRRAHSRGG